MTLSKKVLYLGPLNNCVKGRKILYLFSFFYKKIKFFNESTPLEKGS
jgi:hypothetical protein